MTDGLYVAARRWLRWSQSQFGETEANLRFSDPDSPLQIDFLQAAQVHFDVVADWLWAEWSEPRGESLQNRKHLLRSQLNLDRLPIALVATWHGEPAGTVSLRAKDLRTRPRATPWLSALYVNPDFRGKGIGRALVTATEELAAWLGYRHLYLFTPDRQSFYLELGWTHLPRLPEEEHHQPPSDVFMKALS